MASMKIATVIAPTMTIIEISGRSSLSVRLDMMQPMLDTAPKMGVEDCHEWHECKQSIGHEILHQPPLKSVLH